MKRMAAVAAMTVFSAFLTLTQGCFLDQSNDAGMVSPPPGGIGTTTVYMALDTTKSEKTVAWKAGDPAKSALAGQWKVTVPAGAATLAVDLTVREATVLTQPPSGTLLPGALEVKSNGVTLSKPVELTLDYSVPGLPPGALGRMVSVVRYDPAAGTLEILPGSTASESLRSAYGQVSSFSIFAGLLSPVGAWKIFALRGEASSEGAVLADIGAATGLLSQPMGRWSSATSTGGTFGLTRKTQTAYLASGSFDFTQAEDAMAGAFDGTFNLTSAGGTGTWKAVGGSTGTWRAVYCGRTDLVAHSAAATEAIDGFMNAVESRTIDAAMAWVSTGVAKTSPVAYEPAYSGRDGLKTLLTTWTDARDYSGLAYKKHIAEDSLGRVTAAVAITYPRYGGLWLMGLTNEAGTFRIVGFDF